MLDIILGVLVQGFIYAIMALGVYITYRILDFPDLTVDGSFPLGAAITAVLLINGVNIWLCLLAAFAAGILAGLCTGVINVKLGVKDLLSGIITMTALYTINLHITGKSNLPFFKEDTIFTSLPSLGIPTGFGVVILVAVLAIGVKLTLDWYLSTKSGFLLRCCGDNPQLVTELGRDVGTVKIIGLALANGLAALSGGVMCQYQRFFEITMGTGTIVIGLATVIIGINIFKRLSALKITTKVIIGAIVYKGCVALAIAVGFDPIDMKFITAALFLIVLVLNSKKRRKVQHAEIRRN